MPTKRAWASARVFWDMRPGVSLAPPAPGSGQWGCAMAEVGGRPAARGSLSSAPALSCSAGPGAWALPQAAWRVPEQKPNRAPVPNAAGHELPGLRHEPVSCSCHRVPGDPALPEAPRPGRCCRSKDHSGALRRPQPCTEKIPAQTRLSPATLSLLASPARHLRPPRLQRGGSLGLGGTSTSCWPQSPGPCRSSESLARDPKNQVLGVLSLIILATKPE